MKVNARTLGQVLWALAGIALAAGLASAATPPARPLEQQTARRLITQPINNRQLVRLRGNTYPLARPAYDRGPAPVGLPADEMILVLKRSAAQEAALETMLAQQQDAASPDFHQWLTPAAFGQRFGLDPADLQAVSQWLTSEGFQIGSIANGRQFIEFSGTAGEVAAAFHTAIHRYVIQGRSHWANDADPEIPAALAPAVAGVVSLNNFGRHPQMVVAGRFAKAPDSARAWRLGPEYTYSGNCGALGGPGNCYALGPYDLAAIYNILPLWNSGIDGTGETIAIVGQSDVDTLDITNFCSTFGLPATTVNVIHNGPDPGIVNEGSPSDESESDLDLEWAGAVAKGATLDFVVSATTDVAAGVDLSALYIVDNDLAPILSESYGACELEVGTTGNEFYDQLWQQAAAEGISVFVGAGDSGSAGCDPPGTAVAQGGLAVSGLASPVNAVAVGGTDFDDFNLGATYWNSTNDPTTLASAKGYIPEIPWNDSCASTEMPSFGGTADAAANCNNQTLQQEGFLNTVAGGGGMSSCTTSNGQSPTTCDGGYAKPPWQPGTDGHRDLPDVSLFAGNGLNGSFYILCEGDIEASCMAEDGAIPFAGAGGTSAAAPAWAGIQALVDQKAGGPQGDPHYILYKLASQQTAANCNASASPNSSCVFNDITQGTNAVPCTAGTPNCSAPAGDADGVLPGYDAAAGYDLATGLGTPNVANLVAAWAGVTFTPSQTTLSLSPTTNLTHGMPVSVGIAVAPRSGAGTPTGLVSLITSHHQGVTDFSLSGGAATGSTADLPGGTYTVTAHYPGDGTFAPSNSSPISLSVAPEPSIVTETISTPGPQGNPESFASLPYGSLIDLEASVKGQSGQGVPTGTINFANNGTTLADGPFPLDSDASTETPHFYASYTLSAGQYSLVANYSGDSSFSAGGSAPANFTITKDPTTISVPGGSDAIGSSQYLEAYVTAQTYGLMQTGTVQFYDGGNPLGAPVTIGGGEGNGDSWVIDAFLFNPPFAIGPNTITAVYSGDANYAGSTAAAVVVDDQIPTTMSVTFSSPTVQPGGTEIVTFHLAPAQTNPAPIDGSVQIITLPGNPAVPVVSGQAEVSIPTTKAEAGTTVDVVAIYSGDSYYAAGASVSSSFNVAAAPDFSLSNAPASLSIAAPGGTAQTTISVAAQNGFTGNVTFTCTGLPAKTTCGFNPASVAAGKPTVLTIITTAPSTALLPPPAAPAAPPWDRLGWELGLAGLLGLALLLLTSGYRRRRAVLAPALAIVLFAALALAACGGGGGGGSNNSQMPQAIPGTPPGNYTVVVTGTSGTLSHSLDLGLNIG